jgi:hypothetical protein
MKRRPDVMLAEMFALYLKTKNFVNLLRAEDRPRSRRARRVHPPGSRPRVSPASARTSVRKDAVRWSTGFLCAYLHEVRPANATAQPIQVNTLTRDPGLFSWALRRDRYPALLGASSHARNSESGSEEGGCHSRDSQGATGQKAAPWSQGLMTGDRRNSSFAIRDEPAHYL